MSAPELRQALSEIFQRPVTTMLRAPSPCSSSFAIEELQIQFGDGEVIEAVFKDLSPGAMLEAARSVRPDFLYEPQREIEVYRALLSRFRPGAPKLYGYTVDPAEKRYWLFVEKVDAPPLLEIGAFETWLEAARWLGRFHSVGDETSARAAAPLLITHDAAFYEHWIHRAHRYRGAALDPIAQEYERVIQKLLQLPRAWIHGEFYPSNILVREAAGPAQICPIDWEMAATGPALMDVAALASGRWNRSERLRILDAYLETVAPGLRPPDAIEAFDCCQLQVAIQWLGWSPNWKPYEPHAHDWLADARQIAALQAARDMGA
jgi:hypothetical protein